jgi:AraC-like DNA-binding protein
MALSDSIATHPQSFRDVARPYVVETRIIDPSLYDVLTTFPNVRDYLEVFLKATGVSLRILPTRTVLRRAIAVPVWAGNEAVAWLVANPRGHDLSARRRQGIRQLLRLFGRDLSILASQHLNAPHVHPPPCVNRANEYIHAHFREPLPIADVARHVGFCPDHFGRIFARWTGLTFTDYVGRVRVEKVKEMLSSTQQGVGEVALVCGFDSIPHFNRLFKRQTGLTPRAYRAAHVFSRSKVG